MSVIEMNFTGSHYKRSQKTQNFVKMLLEQTSNKVGLITTSHIAGLGFIRDLDDESLDKLSVHTIVRGFEVNSVIEMYVAHGIDVFILDDVPLTTTQKDELMGLQSRLGFAFYIC